MGKMEIFFTPRKRKHSLQNYCTHFDIDSNQTDCFYNSPGAVNEYAINQAATIYPNPTTGKVNVEFQSQLTASGAIAVYNIFGQCVETFAVNASAIELDLSKYKSGIYLIEIINQDHKIIGHGKVIKY